MKAVCAWVITQVQRFWDYFSVRAEDIFCTYWEGKAVMATCLAVLVKVFTNTHVIIFLAFNGLVILDFITKQIALGGQYIALKRHIPIEQLHLRDKIKGMRPAFNAGYIESFLMRDKFLDKMGVYFVAVACAKLTDMMIINSPESITLHMMYAYLGAVECLSILENMRDGGSPMMGKILSLIETKLMNKLK